jgi:hypothetical protein
MGKHDKQPLVLLNIATTCMTLLESSEIVVNLVLQSALPAA